MKIFLFSFTLCVALSFASEAYAQEYTTIVDLPNIAGMTDYGEQPTTEEYVNLLYYLAITVGSLLAVVKIIIGGVKYMLSDVVTSKGDALKDIRGALLGLLIILSAVLILNTINVNLTTLSIFENAPEIGNIQSNSPNAPGQPNPNSLVMGTTVDRNGMNAQQYLRFQTQCRSEGGEPISVPPSSSRCIPRI